MVLIDLMGGKAADVELGTMALPARPHYWIVIMANWKPEITGPSGKNTVCMCVCLLLIYSAELTQL